MTRRRNYTTAYPEIDEACRHAPPIIFNLIEALRDQSPDLYRDDPALRQDISFGPECSFFADWRWVNPIRPRFEKPKAFVQLELPFK